jgi:hypothetical protein
VPKFRGLWSRRAKKIAKIGSLREHMEPRIEFSHGLHDFRSRFGDQIRQAEIDRRAPARQHLVKRRRCLLEGRERTKNIMGIDVANRRHVGLARGADDDRAALGVAIAA